MQRDDFIASSSIYILFRVLAFWSKVMSSVDLDFIQKILPSLTRVLAKINDLTVKHGFIMYLELPNMKTGFCWIKVKKAEQIQLQTIGV